MTDNRARPPKAVDESSDLDSTCINCHSRIGRSHRGGAWFHWATASIWCSRPPEDSGEFYRVPSDHLTVGPQPAVEIRDPATGEEASVHPDELARWIATGWEETR